MARGKKLDLNIGANFEDDSWAVVEQKKVTPKLEIMEPNKHQLHFRREKRRGKVVTLVGPFGLEKSEAAAIVKKLKKKLGCGGGFSDGFMEFQGEMQEKLRSELSGLGFRFKK